MKRRRDPKANDGLINLVGGVARRVYGRPFVPCHVCPCVLHCVPVSCTVSQCVSQGMSQPVSHFVRM